MVVCSQMRTFPKSLAIFRRIINERGEKLFICIKSSLSLSPSGLYLGNRANVSF